jgi:hypothetical protein
LGGKAPAGEGFELVLHPGKIRQIARASPRQDRNGLGILMGLFSNFLQGDFSVKQPPKAAKP